MGYNAVMRHWIILVLIVTGLAAVFWFWERRIEIIPPSAGARSPDTSVSWGKAKQTVLGWAQQPGEIFKDLARDIAQTASEKTEEFKQSAEQEVREKLAEAILPTPPSSPTPAPEFTSPEILVEAQNALRLDICLIRSLNQSVQYRVANPFYNQTEAKYRVDWGDGESFNGTFAREEMDVLLSHLYRASGTYKAIFEVNASGTTVRVESRVCGD